MSHEARDAVWNHSRMTGTARVVMLAIAEFTNKDKGTAWPGLKTLTEYVGVSKRSVIRAIQQCEEAGELKVERGVGAGNTNSYRILLMEKGDASVTIAPKEKGDTFDQKGDGDDTNKGDTFDQKGDASVTQSVKNSNTRTVKNSNGLPPALDTDSFRVVWGRWEKHRREKRAKLTPTTRKAQLKKAAEYGEEAATWVINLSIQNGWQGLFWNRWDKQQAQRQPQQPRYDEPAEIMGDF